MHYNVQVHIQRVETVPRASSTLKDDFRKVTEVLELKITAESEAVAYERALRVLSMNAPESELPR